MSKAFFRRLAFVGSLCTVSSPALAYDCVSTQSDEPGILGRKVTLRNVCPMGVTVNIHCENGRKYNMYLLSCRTDWFSVSVVCGHSSQGFEYSFPTSNTLCR
jgi:hypothetical protein